jgi:transcriptional/translational regulatory protein YebC/TACO1
MAGHSQFKNIMHRKGRVDAVRSKVFSKLAREITVAAKLGTPDEVMEAAIEAGADDVESDAEGHSITTTFEAMGEVAAALEKALGEPESVKAIWRPQNTVPVDAEKGATLMKVIGLLEDDDDVQNVYANFEISDEDLARIEA